MKRSLIVLLLVAGLGITACAPKTDSSDALIRDTLHKQFDQAGVTLELDPVLVSGDHALVDWSQGTMGGRALLQMSDGGWRVVLCAGDGIRSQAALEQAGVPAADARRLSEALTKAEASMPKERLQKLSRFGGIMRMDGQTSHK
ncbi:hypothetical protein MMA231_03742 (plasmid) [Asticcacaulis sp. MM231]|uniref:copper uptake system-associated protein n=1 Tax=Asticcacaulis sp. MM231 TaxID=3157666 RepID=UPI0032D58163